MSTRATIRFATREAGVSFNEHPEKWNAQFYKHHDGYPEGLGVDLANCIIKEGSCNGVTMEIEPLNAKHGDLEYIYYVWQGEDKNTWISIFEVGSFRHSCGECGSFLSASNNQDKCIFVGEPQKLLEKYDETKLKKI